MRQKRTVQGSIFDLYAEHEIGRELKAMSDWLDKHPEILDWIAPELCRAEIKETGREGLSVESIVRSAILKQHRQLSYEALAFHLEDSHSFQAFAPRQIAADGGARQQRQRAASQRQRREGCGLPQKEGPEGRADGEERLGLSQAAQLRAGIEAGISCLKRSYGLSRCTWKGLEHFKSYVWSAVVAHNLAVFSRLLAR